VIVTNISCWKTRRLGQVGLQRQTLYSKQGRSGQFDSRAQRDDWIRKEMDEIQQSHNLQTSQAGLIENTLQTLRSQLKQVSEKIEAVRNQETLRKVESENLMTELVNIKAERDKLTDQRK